MNPAARPIFKSIVILVLLSAAFFTATGHLDTLINTCGGAVLSDANRTYLDESFDRSMKGFLVLSAIKGGLAVLEGSEVGVGFNLEVGDIVQSIYDYVDVAWKTALAGGTILLLIQLILQTIQLFDHWCLFLLLLIALSLFSQGWLFPGHKRLNRILKECLLFVSVLTVALYIILPVSIAGAAFLSKQITRPLVEEAQQGFESLQQDLSPQALNERLFPESEKEDSLWSRLDFNAKLQNCKAAIMEMAEYLEEITEEFAVWTIKIIAGYLFDCIIFPGAFFIAVYILAKNLLAYAIGIRRDYTIREDFETVIARYYGK
jgi:hypothetical protein